MSALPKPAQTYVTQEQFDSQSAHIDQRLNSFERALQTFATSHEAAISQMSSELRASSKPQVGNLLGMVSILCVIAGMAATLASNTINSKSELSESRDAAIQLQLDNFNTESNRFSKLDAQLIQEDQRGINQSILSALKQITDDVEVHQDQSFERHLEQSNQLAVLETSTQTLIEELRTRQSWMIRQSDLTSRNDERLNVLQKLVPSSSYLPSNPKEQP